MELDFQWDLLEDDIPFAFEKLWQSIKHRLLNLKSFIQGKSMMAPQNLEDSTNLIGMIRTRIRSHVN